MFLRFSRNLVKLRVLLSSNRKSPLVIRDVALCVLLQLPMQLVQFTNSMGNMLSMRFVFFLLSNVLQLGYWSVERRICRRGSGAAEFAPYS